MRFAAPLLDPGGVELLGLLEPVALCIVLDDLGAVEESIDDAGGAREDPSLRGRALHRSDAELGARRQTLVSWLQVGLSGLGWVVIGVRR